MNPRIRFHLIAELFEPAGTGDWNETSALPGMRSSQKGVKFADVVVKDREQADRFLQRLRKGIEQIIGALPYECPDDRIRILEFQEENKKPSCKHKEGRDCHEEG